MFCKKSTVTNSSNKISSISYRRCSDNMIIPNHLLNPGEVVNIWYIDGTLLTAEQGQNISDTYSFPPISPSRTALPTRTPRSTPSITPSNTQTPTNSPTISLTASPTKSLGTTPNPTNSPTPTRNPNTTPQATTTPTITSSGKYNLYRPQVRQSGELTAQLSCSAANLQIFSPSLLIGYTTKPLNQLTTGDQIFNLQTNQPISFLSNRWQPFTDVEILTQNTPIYTTFFAAGSNSVISQIQNCFSVIPTPTPTISPTITSNFTYDVYQDCCSILDNQRTPSYISVLKNISGDINVGFGFTTNVNNQNSSWVKISTSVGSYPGSTIITYNGGFQGPNYCSTIDPIPALCPNQTTPQPTSTPTVTNTVSPTNTPSPTTSRSFDTTPLSTPDATPTPTVSPTISPTVSPTVSVSPTRSFSPDSFVIEIETVQPNQTVSLPLIDTGSYNFNVSWGDNSTDQIQEFLQRSHTYQAVGTYTIIMTGTINGWSYGSVGNSPGSNGSPAQLKRIIQWGNVNFTSQTGVFAGCINLISVDCPDLPLLGTNLRRFFFGCENLTTINRINEWNVSNVINFPEMFNNCNLLNIDVSNWDMSSCNDVTSMFQNCFQFNSNLSNWNLSPNITRQTCRLSSFLLNATAFNSPIFSGVSLSPLTNTSIFRGATLFNQPLLSWDVSQTTNLSSMFASCTNFNQNISYFAFTGASQPVMNGMFSGATSFNQDLSSWCVSLILTQPTNFNINANSTWVNTPSKQPRWGQPCNNSVIIGTVSSPINSIVEVPIVFNVNSPVNLGAISLKIVYNPTLLSCATPRISYTWSGFTSNPSYLDNCATFAGACGINQAIVVAWSSVDGPSFVGGELLKLRFNTLGTIGSTPLTVTCIPEDNEIANQSGTVLNVTFVNGSVNITQ